MRRPNLTKTLTGRLLLLGGLSLWSLSNLGYAQVKPTPDPTFTGGIDNCALPAGTIPSQSRAVFVLDTSGSMRGIGDGKANIFKEVKASVERYVDSAQPDQVKLITFDSGVRGERSYDLPAQASQLRSDLENLKADGNNTYLYRSMHAALSPLAASDRYVTSVFVMTDGIDNDPQPRYSAEGALSSFQARGTLDSLSYIALGSDIPSDAKKALAASDYASGITLAPGEVPDLVALNGGVRLATVTDPSRVPAPFGDGTLLKLAAQDNQVTLAQPAVVSGTTQLRVPKSVPAGSAALLCAPATTDPKVVGPRTRRVLLKLQPGTAAATDTATPVVTRTTVTTTTTQTDGASQAAGAPTATTTVQSGQGTPAAPPSSLSNGLEGLLWLNPGTQTVIEQGQQAVLRYRATPGLALDGSQLLLPAGLQGFNAVLERQPGSREFDVRVVRNTDSAANGTLASTLPGGLLTPRLLLPTGQIINLTPLQVGGLPAQNVQAAVTTLPVSTGQATSGQTVPGQTTANQTAPGTNNGQTNSTTTTSTTADQDANRQAQSGQQATTPSATSNSAGQTTAGQEASRQATQAQQAQQAQAQPGQNGQAQTQTSQTTQTTTTQTRNQEKGSFPWWLLLLALLALGLLGLMALLLGRKRGATGTGTMAAAAVKGNRPPPPPKKVAPAVVAAPVALPAVATNTPPARIEGVHYRDDRTLALVGLDGEVRGIPTPLSGPFDLGQVSRVAELRGLRAEQLHEGLQLVQIPEDLIVSHDTKLLSAGDLVAAGTLLSIIPAASAGTAARPSLGSLTGLGRPLMLRANGAHLEISGPYGDHLLNLTPGILDLGELLEAPALRGLRLSTRGYRILLTDVPAGLSVAPSGEHTPLKPGMYLPERTGLLLRGL